MAKTNIKDLTKVWLYQHPASLIMTPCKFAHKVVHVEAPAGAMLCLKKGECSCQRLGQTLPDDRMPTADGSDEVDKLMNL